MTGSDPSEFATLLRALRVQRGLSQQKLADLAGVSVGVVSSAEAGRSVPAGRTAVALHRALSRAEPIDGTTSATWANILSMPISLLHHSPITAAVLDAADPRPRFRFTPAHQAAEAHAILGNLLSRADATAVLKLLNAAEHLLGIADQPAAMPDQLPPPPPGAVRSDTTGPDGQPVTVYHPTTQPTPAADPQRRDKPQAGQQ